MGDRPLMGQAMPKATLRPFLPTDTPILAAIFVASISELTGDDYSETQQAAWASAAEDEAAFGGLVQAVFTRRRKTLANALLAFPPAVAATPARMLRDAGIDGGRRPETLSLPEFVRLADTLAPPR